MDNQNNKQTLAEILKVDGMPEKQKEEVVARVGGLIIEASVGALLLTLNEDQLGAIEEYLNHVTDNDDIFAYLLRTYPDFQSIVEKEIAALEQQAADVLS
jgi:hypothetical protein